MELQPVDLNEIFPSEPKVPTVQKVTLETKEFHVIDPDTGEVVGYIDAPMTYCSGMSCPHKAGKKHPFGFINPLNSRVDKRSLWVHEHCLLPTQLWWRGQWRSMVRGGKVMPWEQEG